MNVGHQDLEHEIGDTVQDGDCHAVITDIRSGRYILRPEHKPMGPEWSPEHPEDLVLVVRRGSQPAARKHPDHDPRNPPNLSRARWPQIPN